MGFLPKREICAANKYTRRIDAYIHYYGGKRKKPRANPKCPFCPKFRRVKTEKRVKDKEIRYGKTDSCSGDSGGPLWKWMGKVNTKANSPTFTLSRIFNSNAIIFKIDSAFSKEDGESNVTSTKNEYFPGVSIIGRD